ncbi:MAG: DUF6141 family protein [Actinobacteria bacterium]|nr:DUF6141 family protein [Actinomycetota bacterium]
MESRSRGSVVGDASPLVFREVQRFRQWFFWIPIAAVTGVVWWQFWEQVVRQHPQGQHPIPNWAAWLLAIVFGLGFPAFAAVVRLITTVTSRELSIRLAPFKTRRIPLDSIATAMARQYSPMGEFGGWGIRVSRNGKAYNAYGDMGVQLELKDGSRVLVGSQLSEEFVAALRLGGVRILR